MKNLKKIFLTLILTLATVFAFAQTWPPNGMIGTIHREREYLKRKTLLIFIDFSKYSYNFAALIKK